MEPRQEAASGDESSVDSPRGERSRDGIRGVHTDLHERASDLHDCETAASVRSEAVAVIQSVLGHEAVGFYECDGDQFVATHRSDVFRQYGGPATVESELVLAEAVEMGRPQIDDDTAMFESVETVCAVPTGFEEVVVCPFVSAACLGDRFRTHLNEIATVTGTALYRLGTTDPESASATDRAADQVTTSQKGESGTVVSGSGGSRAETGGTVGDATHSDGTPADTPGDTTDNRTAETDTPDSGTVGDGPDDPGPAEVAGFDETLPRETVLDALDESFPDYAFLHDAEGRYVDVLLGDRNIGETTREAIVDSTVHDVLEQEAADEVLDGIQSAISTGQTQSVQYSVETGDTPRHYEALVSALALDGRDAAILVARDVTERRTQKKQLQERNQRLEEIVSIVSHDLRNPLNTAQGYLGMVQAERADERLATAGRALDRMGEITERILTLVAHEDADLSLEPISVESVVDHCWELTETDRAALETTETFEFRADRASLRHLFENLFRNAVDHCDGAVTVRVGQTDEGFYVADDGPGIPESERETVFESGHTSAEDGSGIGLAVVETVADAHGWDVSVCDSWAGGARFEFTGVEVVEQEQEQSDLLA